MPPWMRQGLVAAAFAAGALLLMPCSPWSVWGAANCPAGPSAAPSPVPGGIDFAKEVQEASGDRPVLVQFHAGWCGPCRRLGPELDQAVAARSGGVGLVKIDVDDHPDLARLQGVSGIPDVRLWRNGREVSRFTGYRSPAAVQTWLDAGLAP